MTAETFCQAVVRAAKLDKHNLFESLISEICPDAEADNVYWFDGIENMLSTLEDRELTNRIISYSKRTIIRFTHLTDEQFDRIYDALGW